MKRFHVIGSMITLIGLFLLGGGRVADAQTLYELAPESRLWIDGSSTVNRFTCEADQADGQGLLGREVDQVEALVRIPVEDFDCGNRRMNKDLYKAMRAQDHPHIVFDLNAVHMVADASMDDEPTLRVVGELALAGTERVVEVEVEGEELEDGRLRATGSIALEMTDFGINPPSGLLGLVKAHDRILVRFDLVASSASLGAAR